MSFYSQPKNVQKSIRLTNEVYEAIDGYRGEGFNDKLGNLVMEYLKGRERMEREAASLQELINAKHAELKRLQKQVAAARVVDSRLGPLVDAVTAFLDV